MAPLGNIQLAEGKAIYSEAVRDGTNLSSSGTSLCTSFTIVIPGSGSSKVSRTCSIYYFQQNVYNPKGRKFHNTCNLNLQTKSNTACCSAVMISIKHAKNDK